jgi:hypothetical protein
MSGVTAAQAEAQLAAYLAAETAVLLGQSYTIAGRSLTRANLKDIREGIEYWSAKAASAARTGIKIRGGTPV